jgi:hypothetical protein
MKSILIEEDLHELLKEYSKKSGIKIKILVEAALRSYFNKMKFKSEEKIGKRN